MEFTEIKLAVEKQMLRMQPFGLFVVDIDKHEIWMHYLESFKPEDDPMYRERTEHNCQCCKQFIRLAGPIVTFINGEMVSIWDIVLRDSSYKTVADSMSALIKTKPIKSKFLHYEHDLGTNKTHEGSGTDIITWNHFHHAVPQEFVKDKNNIAKALGKHRTAVETFQRALDEISDDAIETVIELIDQNSLYRGEEHKKTVVEFKRAKTKYDKLNKPDNYAWYTKVSGTVSGIRNTVIGTLLTDLSDNVGLNKSVAKYEAKVAPENYKRPNALVTQGMIKKAQETVIGLGYEDSLYRRYAVMEDITVKNVLFANRDAKASMNVFEELQEDVKDKMPNLDKIEEIGIDDFVANVLDKAHSLEIMMENKHTNNLVSLIAPVKKDAPNILKWDNNFSWSYNGEVTDSIKERVKKAGGQVEAVLRCSLSWFNIDDLDIHVKEPDGNVIYFSSKLSRTTGGRLDIDMNAANLVRDPVENIRWTNKAKITEGVYEVIVHNFTKRENIDVGFEVEIDFEGDSRMFVYEKAVPNHKKITVAKFEYTKANGIKLLSSITEGNSSKDAWNIATQKFQNVSVVMQSPNHWDGQVSGNKHWFFMLTNCKNDDQSRGLYNEFLKPELQEHRKVFEMLGSKLKTPISDDQLSGIGFSSTKRASMLCRVTGAFNRVVKINF